MDTKLLLLRFLLTNFKTTTPIATTVHFPFHRNQTFLFFPSSPSFHARHSNAYQSRLIPSQRSPSTIISLANTTTTIPMPDSPTTTNQPTNQPKNEDPTTITTTTAKHSSKTQHFQIKKKKKTKKALWSTTATVCSSKLHKIFTKQGQKSVHRLGGGGGGGGVRGYQ